MELNHFTTVMAQNAQRIQALVQDVGQEQARWKPAADSWSMLEVICHLYDEEREDFRVRLDYTLHRPGEPWPSIDPQGWVTQRHYNQRALDEMLQRFLDERRRSLDWLGGLSAANWETTYQAPWGDVRAGDLFAAWVAHDLLHARQLVELHWAYTNEGLAPFNVGYAGEW